MEAKVVGPHLKVFWFSKDPTGHSKRKVPGQEMEAKVVGPHLKVFWFSKDPTGHSKRKEKKR